MSIDTLTTLFCNLHIINYYKTLSLKSVLVIGIQLIKRIKILHEKFLLHRDIKPSNLLFGNGNDVNKLFLLDFGFSKRYEYNGSHIEEKCIKQVVGSPNFVSLNVHTLIEPSRRDDVESCIYVILTMLFGNLSWFNNIDMDNVVFLKTKLLETYELPLCIKNMLLYVKTLSFKETPDYDYLIQLMKDNVAY